MKRIQHICPLCWFLLIWFLFIAWNMLGMWHSSNTGIAPMFVLFFLLMSIHFALYWMMLSREMEPFSRSGFLLIQAGWVLVMTHLTDSPAVAFTFSLALFMVAVDTLKEIRLVFIAGTGYLMVLLVYAFTLGSSIPWQLLWNGQSTVSEVLAFFVLIGFVLYLQQEHAHRRTQVLLQQLDVTHAQLGEAHAQVSAYALHVEELTMINERQRIARDLHDTLVQGVAGLIMQLEVASNHVHQQDMGYAQELLHQIMEDARDTLADARCALGDLRTGRLRPDDLVDVVQEEIARFSAVTEISCTYDIDQLVATPAELCEQVLRVIGEGLNNIAHHAQASHVSIQTTHYNGLLAIEVRDDGIGFDPTLVSPQKGHYGLLGIRERARLVGGQVTVMSEPGRGTTLLLQIPTPDEGGPVCIQHAFAS
jgi:NarL family two-component system sensor histidine kinase YdfH